MSDSWAVIHYREFYDFPRAFIVEHQGDLLFFDCPFSDTLDDYEADFTVSRVSSELKEQIDRIPWTNLGDHLHRVGFVPTKAVIFDHTKRHAINTEVFDLIERISKTE